MRITWYEENAIKARSRVMISSKMKNNFEFYFWHDARKPQAVGADEIYTCYKARVRIRQLADGH